MTTLTWETATDWDNAQSEDDVVHQTYTGGDRDAAQVMLGYAPSAYANLEMYYPSDEDSGTTINDVVNGRDLSTSGPTPGVAGIGSSTAWNYDGTDDEAATSSQFGLPDRNNMTMCCWVNFDTVSSSDQEIILQVNNSAGESYELRSDDRTNGYYQAQYYDGSNTYQAETTVAPNVGSWDFVAMKITGDSGSVICHVNGTDEASASYSSNPQLDSGVDMIVNNSDRGSNSTIDEVLVFGATLTQSNLQGVRDVFNPNTSPNGSLTTGKKTS